MIGDARFGVSRYSNRAENLDIGTNASDAIGIKGANLDRWSSGLSQITIDGYADPIVGYSGSIPWNRAETNFNLVNNYRSGDADPFVLYLARSAVRASDAARESVAALDALPAIWMELARPR